MRAKSKAERNHDQIVALIPSMVFIDFEASEGSAAGWPIEVGATRFVEADNGEYRMETFGTLIRPAPDWPMSEWSEYAARIHGITREELDKAPSAEVIARDLVEFIGDARPISDAPGNDQPWLDRLLGLIREDGRYRIRTAPDMLNGLIAQGGNATLRAELKSRGKPHRAPADSRVLAEAVMASLIRPVIGHPTPQEQDQGPSGP